MTWKVQYNEAYEVWCLRHRPTLDEELDVVAWMVDCEPNGPPTADPDEKRNRRAPGPSGAEVLFRTFDTPGEDPAGYMIVLHLG